MEKKIRSFIVGANYYEPMFGYTQVFAADEEEAKEKALALLKNHKDAEVVSVQDKENFDKAFLEQQEAMMKELEERLNAVDEELENYPDDEPKQLN